MTEDALRPCPFCASIDIGFFEHVFTGDHSVICRTCGGEGPRRLSRAEAVRLWNVRPVPAELPPRAT